MASFSAVDVALTGFRIVRERPKAVLVWLAVQLVVSVCLALVVVAIFGPAIANLQNLTPSQRADPSQALEMLRQVLPLYLVAIPFGLAFSAILFAAMDRAVLHPDEDRFGYLRVGADELRQLGLVALAAVVGLAAYVALLIALLIVALIISFTIVPMLTGQGAGSGVLIASVIGLGVVVCWVFVYVRLSLASPMTFATRRVDLFGSWELTKGRFWPMLGAYVLAFVLSLAVILLAFVIELAVTAVAGGANVMATAFHPDMSSLGAYMTPARLIGMCVSAVASVLVWPVALAPPAAIYKALTEAEAAAVPSP